MSVHNLFKASSVFGVPPPDSANHATRRSGSAWRKPRHPDKRTSVWSSWACLCDCSVWADNACVHLACTAVPMTRAHKTTRVQHDKVRECEHRTCEVLGRHRVHHNATRIFRCGQHRKVGHQMPREWSAEEEAVKRLSWRDASIPHVQFMPRASLCTSGTEPCRMGVVIYVWPPHWKRITTKARAGKSS